MRKGDDESPSNLPFLRPQYHTMHPPHGITLGGRPIQKTAKELRFRSFFYRTERVGKKEGNEPPGPGFYPRQGG